MRRSTVAVLGLLLILLASAAPALALDPAPAIGDLRDHDVTFEEGAVTDKDLADLDRAAAALARSDAFVKVVVLASPVEGEPSLRAYAEKVLRGVGGGGRKVVFDPEAVGVASSVDDADEAGPAEDDAAAAASSSNSFARGVEAAIAALGEPEGAAAVGAVTGAADDAAASAGTGSGGGFPWVLLLLLLAVVVVVVVFLLRRRRAHAARDEQEHVVLDAGEQKVRERVDRAASLLLELSDPVQAAGAAPAATARYREGATAFSGIYDRLEEADTRDELEALWPEVVHVAWLLECAQAALAGSPEPPAPVADRLFPPPPAAVPVPGQASQPVPGLPAGPPRRTGGYRSLPSSPWLTGAAMAAIELLLRQGFGGGGGGGSRAAGTRARRPPMIDLGGGVLRPSQPSSSGGLTRRGTARSRPRIDIGPSGGSSPGGGSSSGGGAAPRGRGMGRRR